MFDRKTKAMQQGVHDALCDAAGGVQRAFIDAPKVVDRNLRLIVENSKRDKSARPGSSSVHPASLGKRQSWTRAATDSGSACKGDVPRSSGPASPDSTDPPNFPDRC